MEGESKAKGEGEVSSDDGRCLVVDEGRYLAYNGETDEYYLSPHPQPIKGGRAAQSWYGARRFIIDDGSGDSFDKVAVGIIMNEDGKVLVAGDRIKGENVKEEAGSEVRVVPPFVTKYPREEPENMSHAKVFREGWIRLKAQMVKAGYINEDDDEDDDDLEADFPEDKDFYVKMRDRVRNRRRKVGDRHFMDYDIEDSEDEDDGFEFSDVEDTEEEDNGEDDDYGEDDDSEEEDNEEDDDYGEDDESHEDKQSICRNRQVEEPCYMDQDMEDFEDMTGAVTSDMKQLNCRDMFVVQT